MPRSPPSRFGYWFGTGNLERGDTAMTDTNRLMCLERVRAGMLLLAVGVTIFGCAWPVRAAEEDAKRRPEVVAVYYPHWHNYDHGSAWKGEGWTEWEGLKAAVPRFPGHHQPLVPSWGYFDESDPKWSEREIDLAADHGIDVFLYDWYWYSGVKNMEEALEQGFLHAAEPRPHEVCADVGRPRPQGPVLPGVRQGADRLASLAPLAARPGAGRSTTASSTTSGSRTTGASTGVSSSASSSPRSSSSNWAGRRRLASCWRRMDDRLRQAGLPPMHWNGMVADPKSSAILKEAGFLSTSRYNVHRAGKVGPDLTEQYEDIMQAHRDHWRKMAESAPLVDLPVVTMGWDATPRCCQDVPWPFPVAPTSGRYEYPYVSVVVGNTPERFEQLLREAAQQVDRDPHHPFAVLINAWNEWTEGCYLLPEERTGTAYLEAIKRTFDK